MGMSSSSRSQSKRAGGKKRIKKVVRSSSYVLIVPSLSSSNHVFASLISFGSTIKLVSLDESQVVTFNGEFVCGFRNGDCGTGSRSDNTVGRPHGFIINWIVISKNIKEVTEVIDVENWRIDDSRVLRWIVSLFEWNSFVSSTKSSIQSMFRFRTAFEIPGSGAKNF
ncbi:hypothetical protein Tco_1313318 [Tanacetum coccineum]